MAFLLIPFGTESRHHEFPLSARTAAIAQKARHVVLELEPCVCLPPSRRVYYMAWHVLWVVLDLVKLLLKHVWAI